MNILNPVSLSTRRDKQPAKSEIITHTAVVAAACEFFYNELREYVLLVRDRATYLLADQSSFSMKSVD